MVTFLLGQEDSGWVRRIPLVVVGRRNVTQRRSQQVRKGENTEEELIPEENTHAGKRRERDKWFGWRERDGRPNSPRVKMENLVLLLCKVLVGIMMHHNFQLILFLTQRNFLGSIKSLDWFAGRYESYERQHTTN